MPVRTLDYSALTDPVARADVAAWRSRARASGWAWASRGPLSAASLVAIALFALIFIFVFGGVFASFVADAFVNGDPVDLVFPSIIVIVVAAVTIGAVRSQAGRWQRWFRLDRFADANGMSFRPMDVAPDYPGEIFQVGHNQVVVEHLVSSGRYLDIGNYRYVTGSGKSQTTHNWGFVALHLDRAMPNIVLDAKANNSFFGTNLPVTLDKHQVLHLEGDFDQHFTLYCPAEYEQDALYIFTPDLMALLIDEASPFDVELIDQWMFVYAARPFALTDPAVLQRLFTIADTVGAKALNQTEHYADERIGDPAANIVAPQGARLKRGFSLVGVVVVAGFVAFWGWNFFSNVVFTP